MRGGSRGSEKKQRDNVTLGSYVYNAVESMYVQQQQHGEQQMKRREQIKSSYGVVDLVAAHAGELVKRRGQGLLGAPARDKVPEEVVKPAERHKQVRKKLIYAYRKSPLIGRRIRRCAYFRGADEHAGSSS